MKWIVLAAALLITQMGSTPVPHKCNHPSPLHAGRNWMNEWSVEQTSQPSAIVILNRRQQEPVFALSKASTKSVPVSPEVGKRLKRIRAHLILIQKLFDKDTVLAQNVLKKLGGGGGGSAPLEGAGDSPKAPGEDGKSPLDGPKGPGGPSEAGIPGPSGEKGPGSGDASKASGGPNEAGMPGSSDPKGPSAGDASKGPNEAGMPGSPDAKGPDAVDASKGPGSPTESSDAKGPIAGDAPKSPNEAGMPGSPDAKGPSAVDASKGPSEAGPKSPDAPEPDAKGASAPKNAAKGPESAKAPTLVRRQAPPSQDQSIQLLNALRNKVKRLQIKMNHAMEQARKRLIIATDELNDEAIEAYVAKVDGKNGKSKDIDTLLDTAENGGSGKPKGDSPLEAANAPKSPLEGGMDGPSADSAGAKSPIESGDTSKGPKEGGAAGAKSPLEGADASKSPKESGDAAGAKSPLESGDMSKGPKESADAAGAKSPLDDPSKASKEGPAAKAPSMLTLVRRTIELERRASPTVKARLDKLVTSFGQLKKVVDDEMGLITRVLTNMSGGRSSGPNEASSESAKGGIGDAISLDRPGGPGAAPKETSGAPGMDAKVPSENPMEAAGTKGPGDSPLESAGPGMDAKGPKGPGDSPLESAGPGMDAKGGDSPLEGMDAKGPKGPGDSPAGADSKGPSETSTDSKGPKSDDSPSESAKGPSAQSIKGLSPSAKAAKLVRRSQDLPQSRNIKLLRAMRRRLFRLQSQLNKVLDAIKTELTGVTSELKDESMAKFAGSN